MVRCEHPNIIFYPNIVYLFATKFKRANLFGHVIDLSNKLDLYTNFPWRDFYAAKNEVTVDNLDECVMFNEDGETHPVFLTVPCGHCSLCRDNKVRDLQTRCVCESVMHDYKPLFITLTLDDEHLVSDMPSLLVLFQKFLKRLRIRIDREYGDYPLRYLAVSEYTPTHHRPHVHMLLWGLPYITSQSGEGSFYALNDFIATTWKCGFVKCEICRDSSGSYCLKYMRKGSDADCWCVSSRRRGLGYAFAMSLLPHVIKNPSLTKFSVVDKNGKLKSYLIPAYFRRVWFPTLSVLFPSAVCAAAKEFYEKSVMLKSALVALYGDGHRLVSEIDNMQYYVFHKYDMMCIDWHCCVPHKSYSKSLFRYVQYRTNDNTFRRSDYRQFGYEYMPVLRDGFLVPERCNFIVDDVDDVHYSVVRHLLDGVDMYDFRLGLISSLREVRESYRVLQSYEFSRAEVMSKLAVTSAHQQAVAEFRLTHDDTTTIQDMIDTLQVDLDWIKTHWIAPALC